MIPIKDRNPTTIFPLVTYAIIGVNVFVFLIQLSLDLMGDLDSFILNWAMIPNNVLQGSGLVTLVSSMFLHGGITHIGGNMLYLYIFGNNIEEAFGRLRFLAFYLFCGFCASFLPVSYTHLTLPTN